MAQKRVLITAGAGGIGRRTAQAFLDQGAKVHICDINETAVKEFSDSHENATGSVTNVSSPEDVDKLFEDVKEKLGGLDVLVNNAGISGPTVATDKLPLEKWHQVIDVNLNGTLLVVQHAIPLLKEGTDPAIIVMSSLAGRFGYPNRVAYSTTKWGLVGFTKTLAMEYGSDGITANTIHPGAVEGPRINQVLQGRADASGTTLEEERQKALANQSVKSFVDPDDIAALIVFLAGPHARCISGQMFPIDGDSKSSQ